METDLWAVYVTVVSAGAEERQQDVAERSGVTQATISRWAGGKATPTNPAKVAAFAKAYGRNVLEAFIAAGMLEEEDAGRGLPARSRRYLAELRGLPAGVDPVAYLAIRDAFAGRAGRARGSQAPPGRVNKSAKSASA